MTIKINKIYTATIFFVMIFGLTFNPGVIAEPQLSPEKEGNIDLGVTTEGQVKPGSFTITNSGDSVLKIEHYMVNCTCVEITNNPPEELESGEAGEFKFVFDTSGLAGKKSKKQIILSSNAPNSPHTITISTRVESRSSYQVDSQDYISSFSILVDVRSPEEFSKSHILGAKNVPEEKFSKWARTLPEDVTVYIYSQKGKKSDRLIEELDSELSIEFKSLIGGYEQWKLLHEKYLETSQDN